MRKVIGLGAGGHAKVIVEILTQSGDYEIVGFLDNNKQLWNSSIFDLPVLGGDQLLSMLFKEGLRDAFIGLGSVGDSRPRKELFEKVCQNGYTCVTAVHPSASISSSVKIGQGAAIMASVVINASTWIGENVIVNTGSIVEHDCSISDHVHIATGALLAGGITIHEGAHIGLGAHLLQGITVGKNAVIGAGSVVLNDVLPNTVVVGNPAREIRNPTES